MSGEIARGLPPSGCSLLCLSRAAGRQKGIALIISSLADSVTRGFENIGDAVSGALFEPVIRLGVTGLSRAGKTVFITSLVANLMDRGRIPGLLAASEGRISAAFLQPQPDDTVPRFDYETHLAALTSPVPHWPDSTRAVSELRLSIRVRPAGLLAGLTGPRTIHIDIVDYPGEWLLDLALMDKSYAEWAEGVLQAMTRRTDTESFLAMARAAEANDTWNEPAIKALAESYTATLHSGREAGLSGLTPGRFLMPGEMEGSPALTFAPLPPVERPARRSLWREMERRYTAYKLSLIHI